MTVPRKRLVQVALVLALIAAIVIPVLLAAHSSVTAPKQPMAPQRDCGLLSRFQSEEQLIEHLKKSPYPGPWVLERGAATFGAGPDAAQETAYSGTNVQVAGVDEADMVKTDGTNVYATAWDMNGTHTSIVRAYPPADAALLAKIPSEGWGSQLFVSGDRLVVIAGGPSYAILLGGPWGWWEPTTSVLVYDISDPANPVLAKNVTVSGWYAGSRMIGDVVYLVASAFLWLGENDTVALPTIWTDGVPRALTYADLGYFADSDGSHSATLILAIDVQTDAPPEFESFLTNGAGQMYASADNLYLASASWVYLNDRVVVETTTIHKVAIGADVRYVCSVVVPGSIVNQFAMDERNADLRVATTLGQWTP
ncbi:MAG TPA: beta-propeller domain-containing protein, partial [Thermoplasmata archaeon]|nr:beta-propeller domain-containing protein [Thermoplasmata archaeon]